MGEKNRLSFDSRRNKTTNYSLDGKGFDIIIVN